MPAAGMKRSTRAFGVVMKGSDSGRVLRSGRRLFPEQSVEEKTKRGNVGDDWPKQPLPSKETAVPKKTDRGERAVGDGVKVDRMYGIVYSRKRRRIARSSRLKLYEKKTEETLQSRVGSVLSIVVKPCARKNGRFLSLLVSALRYMSKVTVTLPELFAFFISQSVHAAFDSQGVNFLQGSPPASTGICCFFGIKQFIPLLSVDFSAVPVYFEYLHSAMVLDSFYRSFFIVNSSINAHSEDGDDLEVIDFPEYKDKLQISFDTVEREPSESETVIPDVLEINDSSSTPSPAKGTRQARSRNGQFRSVMGSKGIQKRRSSLRKRKANSPLTMTLRRSNRAVASNLVGGKKRNNQLSGMTSSMRLRSLTNGNTAGSLKKASSAIVDSTHSVESSLCSANILVVESDRCYREDGACVTLEASVSREWLLTVKRDGLTRYTFKAEKVMRSWSSSRFTNATMFSLDNGWKLEFTNRQDFSLFKALYKQCFDRNIPGPVAKFIPVPGVYGVTSYAESTNFIFQRPAAYISVHGDEITRAMARKTANYDMDSDDEEWLRKLNLELQECVSEDSFELIIDAFEKVYFCNPDDSVDVKSAVSSRQDLGSKEVIEAVYTHWIRKRKQKRSLLIRIFQNHQSKRASLIPRPLRKKRSFKRQPGQSGRSNQPSLLRAFAAEQEALEETAMLRLEEAKASAKASMEIAIKKRRRAQSLAENADLATYKAVMLIKIAEAAVATGSVEVGAKYFLD